VGILARAVLALATYTEPDAVRPVVVWTARLTLALFVAAFVLLGTRAGAGPRKVACRAAAFAMALHLLAITRLVQLLDKAPLKFGTVVEAVFSLGGAAAAALVVAGWWYWDRRWYRWAVYWPWGVFLATYVFLTRQGDAAARVVAAPHVFVPVVVLLVGVLAWRVRADFKAVKAGAV
jgi:hypothetical protein